MNHSGKWALSPAFDMTYSYNPAGAWTSAHQMSMNGKRDGFEIEDFRDCARLASMMRDRADEIVEQVLAGVGDWSRFANQAGVDPEYIARIARTHRTDILG